MKRRQRTGRFYRTLFVSLLTLITVGMLGLYYLHRNGATAEPFAGLSLGEIPVASMAWSPDGAKLAVVREKDGDDDTRQLLIEVYDLQQNKLCASTPGGLDSLMIWSPDSQSLLFSGDIDHTMRIRSLSWTPTIQVQDIKSDGFNYLSARPGGWLDDHTLLFFHLDTPRSISQVWTLNTTTHAVAPVAFITDDAIIPVASPQRHLLAYIEKQTRHLKIYSLTSHTQSFTSSETSGKVTDLGWTADGRFLVYTCTLAHQDEIHRVDTDTFTDTRLDTALEFYGEPVISPSGVVAAGARDEQQVNRIYLYDITTGQRICASPNVTGYTAPCWSSDGTMLAYVVRTPLKPQRDYSLFGSKVTDPHTVDWRVK